MLRRFMLCGVMGLAVASSARASSLRTDTFSYPDGPLDNSSTNTTSPWTESSRPTGQIQVTSGAVNLSSANGEAVGAAFTGGTTVSSGIVYAGYDVNFSAMPTASTFNDYFTAFRSTPTGLSARGKIFAVPASDGTSTFQIGVSDYVSNTVTTADPVTYVPMDLSLNTTYRIVESYNISTGRTTVYVNPTSATGGTTSTDPLQASVNIGAFALLDCNGLGTMRLDNLTAATTFAEAVSLLGDANLDGTVDLTDLNIVLNNLGSTTSLRSNGNFDGNPTIDLTDLNDVLNALGTSVNGGTTGGAIVATPEPASMALLSVCAIALLRRRLQG